MKTKIIGLFCLLIVQLPAWAQTVLLEEKVDSVLVKPAFGPNMSHYLHSYSSFGLMLPAMESNQAAVNFPSGLLGSGVRYKKKLTNWYALGVDLGLNIHTVRVKQLGSRQLPQIGNYRKESLVLTALEGGLYQRFNFGKRGNYIGNFIDMGVSAEYLLWATQRIKTQRGGHLVKIKYNVRNYLEDIVPYAGVRLGMNRFMLFARYRMADVFRADSGFDQLPLYTVGIQLGTYK